MARSLVGKGFLPSGVDDAIADLGSLKNKETVNQGLDRGEQAANQQANSLSPTENMNQTRTDTAAAPAANSFLDGIAVQKRRGKDVGFYLSFEIIEAIERLVDKKRGISKSKIAESALRQVLKVE